jgi:hypothetical protein
MKAKQFFIAAALVVSSASVFAQKTNQWQHFVSGGIKRNVFAMGRQEISAANPSPNYSISNIEPDVRSTMSFAVGLESYKKLNDRWLFTNTIGLDMQQLSVETGMQKYFTNGTATSYKTSEINELIPRVKLDVGIEYALIQKESNSFSFGLSAGQMLRLNKAGYSYSFVEGGLSLTNKNTKWFLSGSFSPYNVTIPGSENFFGDIDAESISANAAYRIIDITLGVAVRL